MFQRGCGAHYRPVLRNPLHYYSITKASILDVTEPGSDFEEQGS